MLVFVQLGRCLVAAAVCSHRRKQEEEDVLGMSAVSRPFQPYSIGLN